MSPASSSGESPLAAHSSSADRLAPVTMAGAALGVAPGVPSLDFASPLRGRASLCGGATRGFTAASGWRGKAVPLLRPVAVASVWVPAARLPAATRPDAHRWSWRNRRPDRRAARRVHGAHTFTLPGRFDRAHAVRLRPRPPLAIRGAPASLRGAGRRGATRRRGCAPSPPRRPWSAARARGPTPRRRPATAWRRLAPPCRSAARSPRSSPRSPSARRSRITLRGRKCSRCWRRTQRRRSTSWSKNLR